MVLLHLHGSRRLLHLYLRRLHQQSLTAHISHTNSVSVLPRDLLFENILLPAIPSDQLTDQFAYRPSGSTTAALIATTHHISRLLESCSYVRRILIDYSKAFDTVNHSILFRKLLKLSIPSNILLWIFSFLTDQMQAISSFGQTYLATCYPKYHSRVWHWSMSLLDICIRPLHSVFAKCHHQTC